MTQVLLCNARIAPMTRTGGSQLATETAVLVENGKFQWLGSAAEASRLSVENRIDCGERLLTPGLVDCHTHLVYGGDRALEFEQRLEGMSYEDIARRGGGIISTVRATRAASEGALLAQARQRLDELLAEGVTTVEIKSGYGLDLDNEAKMLRVARQLGIDSGICVKKTFLGAHALPPEYEGRADAYIEHICEHMLPALNAAGLVDSVDVFIETIAFTPAQARRVFETARGLGLPIKAHVEQLSDQGGAVLAAEFQASSVDHLEFLSRGDVPALALAGTVAVLLPGAFYVLRETQLPPVAALREHGVPMALATDSNPGSSPVTSLLLMMNMGCTLFGMTPSEAMSAVTLNAASALGLEDCKGSIEVGKDADLAIWDVTHPAELAYRIGSNPCVAAMSGGDWLTAPRWKVVE
ncbi:MAG: imidazolonepropionase [Halieaceae bacterium]|jgi:imidazolonepropionase